MDIYQTFEGSHSLSDFLFEDKRRELQYNQILSRGWYTDAPARLFMETTPLSKELILIEDYSGVRKVIFHGPRGTLCKVSTENDGHFYLQLASNDSEALDSTYREFRELFTDVSPAEDYLSVRFWTKAITGARFVHRQVLANSWAEIERNYTEGIRSPLGDLMKRQGADAEAGKLILWSGPAGTGKSHALRALAREWKSWCEVHYIIDPMEFFQGSADYLFDVAIMGDGGDKWRLIVIEDAGELLTADAKQYVGQGLTRFLNLCDGLVGQGLRIQLLLTTNEDISKFHEAVTRPGRMQLQLEFNKLSREESSEWMGEPLTREHTLAELYALKRGETVREVRKIGLV